MRKRAARSNGGVYRRSKANGGRLSGHYNAPMTLRWHGWISAHVIAAICLAGAVAAGSSAWKEAAPGRRITLPGDHASHPEYKLEWCYYTGNLDGGGRRFGYQLTF